MAEQLVAVPRLRAPAFDQDALTGADIGAVAPLLESAKKLVMGTLSARASACSVEREGDVPPFSIFDSIPGESSASVANSVAVS